MLYQVELYRVGYPGRTGTRIFSRGTTVDYRTRYSAVDVPVAVYPFFQICETSFCSTGYPYHVHTAVYGRKSGTYDMGV